MVNTTNKAAKRLREHLIDKCFEVGIGFRVLVNSSESGKSTFSIKLDRERPQDQIIESNGVKLFLDPASAARISDYQLDYLDEPDDGFFLKATQEVKGG
jgi:iron-sulfur cluster assembly protein